MVDSVYCSSLVVSRSRIVFTFFSLLMTVRFGFFFFAAREGRFCLSFLSPPMNNKSSLSPFFVNCLLIVCVKSPFSSSPPCVQSM